MKLLFLSEKVPRIHDPCVQPQGNRHLQAVLRGLLLWPDLRITEYGMKRGLHLWTNKPKQPLKMNFRIEKGTFQLHFFLNFIFKKSNVYAYSTLNLVIRRIHRAHSNYFTRTFTRLFYKSWQDFSA